MYCEHRNAFATSLIAIFLFASLPTLLLFSLPDLPKHHHHSAGGRGGERGRGQQPIQIEAPFQVETEQASNIKRDTFFFLARFTVKKIGLKFKTKERHMPSRPLGKEKQISFVFFVLLTPLRGGDRGELSANDKMTRALTSPPFLFALVERQVCKREEKRTHTMAHEQR